MTAQWKICIKTKQNEVFQNLLHTVHTDDNPTN